ncbi:probable ATP-dependent RNA helicase CG8611 [Diorhabda carinulata]|uniref:probable ATP-dependent RNA helicase CG8611 n=1 Tax=Diorhabda carinulata TaxID=1163345 RepID=UPI0025A168FB|nr:probable ATP-dependent RNA helicase CG8611 [Diorhabda carinulata]
MTSFNFVWNNDSKAPKSAIVAKKRKKQNENVDISKKLSKTTETLETSIVGVKNEKKQREIIVSNSDDKAETSNKEFNKKKFNKSEVRVDKIAESTKETDTARTFIKRKWKKDKLAAKKAAKEGNPIPSSESTKTPQQYSLFNVGRKDIYVKGNSKGKSVVEKVFSTSKSFSDLEIHKYIVSNLEKHNFTTLTNVQEKAIPVILKGRNVLIRSQTGSGKTLAYAVPILNSVQSITPRLQRTDGVQAIIIVPTRELALQTQELLKKINTFQWIVVGNLCGGENRNTEKNRLRKGVHILVATPGRLLDHMLHTNAFKTQNVRCLVLDEADRLLDMGFKKDIVSIVEELDRAKKNSEYDPLGLLKKTLVEDNKVEEDINSEKMPLANVSCKSRQTVLLSATLTKGIAELADFTMKDHVYVDALEEFTTQNPEMMVIPETVKQMFIVTHVKHRLFTLSALLLHQSKINSKVFVFMGTSNMVDYHYELFTRFLVKMPRIRGELNRQQLVLDREEFDSDDEEVVVDVEFFKLHGNMDQSARKDVFGRFRAAEKGILLCTDVVARGIDVPAADCIVQYNGPQSIEDYLHRVGRTGRAGKSGTSFIFLTHEEQDFVTHMEKHRVYLQKQEADTFLSNLSDVMDEKDREQAATALQRRYETALENDKQLHKSACNAYSSWSRFYNTYSNKMRPIFDFKKANLGHYVTSFALKETPTAVARLVKGQFVKKESRRLNKKLANHENDIPLQKPPKKKKIKSVSLSTSEFSSGLEPVKKKKKKNLDNDD